MSDTFISIIMPVYQVEQYIKQSLQSVINQTYKNFEIIIVNDGSKDNSISIARDILEKSNIKYTVVNQENAGQGFARNTGIETSKGEWILFIDSDDIILPNTVERLTRGIDEDIDIVISNFADITDVSEIEYGVKESTPQKMSAVEIQKDFLLRKKIVLTPGTLYRKDFLIENNLFFEKIPWSEDQHFVWRNLLYCRNVCYLDEKLYQYFRHGNSIMSSTKIEKIIQSYPFIKAVENMYPEKSIVHKFLASRWVVGTLDAATRLCDKKDWLILYKKIDGRKSFRRVIRFPKLIVKLLGVLGSISPRLYYFLYKKVVKSWY